MNAPASNNPLAGLRIAVTRAESQAAELSARLRSLGAEVIEIPAIETRPPEDWGPVDAAIAHLADYDWIIFSSANGVRYFMERLAAAGVDRAALRARICAIGPATRRAAEHAGLRVELMPAEFVAESLVEAFSAYELKGSRMLWPRAAAARQFAPGALRARGAQVEVVATYRTVPPDDLPARARAVFCSARKPDWVTFTSTSTVVNLVNAVGPEALHGVRIASIGPVTSEALRRFGLGVTVEASPYTSDGLVEAILRAAQEGPAHSRIRPDMR